MTDGDHRHHPITCNYAINECWAAAVATLVFEICSCVIRTTDMSEEYKKFTDHKFVIQEARRLLGQTSQPTTAVAANPAPTAAPAAAAPPAPVKTGD